MNPTTRFSDRAADYRAARPGYGSDVLEFVLDGLSRPLCVADLGAGTGISARLLAERGADVIAIEPNAAMRESAEAAPHLTYQSGTGEATGLPDRSVNLVTAFQAFHWFANAAALAEIQRILRPAGRAALVLNERAEHDAFTAGFGDVVRQYALDDTESRRQQSIETFKQLPGVLAQREFTQLQRIDRDGLQRRAASASYLPRSGTGAPQMQADLDALFERFARDRYVSIALRTIVVRIDIAGAL